MWLALNTVEPHGTKEAKVRLFNEAMPRFGKTHVLPISLAVVETAVPDFPTDFNRGTRFYGVNM